MSVCMNKSVKRTLMCINKYKCVCVKRMQKYKYIYRICLIFLVNFCFPLLSNCITVFNNLYKFQFSFSFYFVYFVILMLFVFMITQFCRDILLKVFTFEGFLIILTAICCILNILTVFCSNLIFISLGFRDMKFYKMLQWPIRSNSIKKQVIYNFISFPNTLSISKRNFIAADISYTMESNSFCFYHTARRLTKIIEREIHFALNCFASYCGKKPINSRLLRSNRHCKDLQIAHIQK